MALIKCNECGQMVSDKAEACPHCGCPVEKTPVCPECGQEAGSADATCSNCGYPLQSPEEDNQQTTYSEQETQQVDNDYDYDWDDKESSGNNLKWILIAVAGLLALAATIFWLTQRTPNQEVVEDMCVDTTAVVVEEVAPIDSVEAVPEVVAEEPIDDGAWLQGTWRYKGEIEGTYLDWVLVIDGNHLTEKLNGKVQYSGNVDYVPQNKFIVYNDGRNLFNVSPETQRIELIDGKYFTKISGNANTSSVDHSSYQRSGELAEIRAQIESERSELAVYFEEFKSLMQQYGTSSPNPYVYDNLMGCLNRMIRLADKGEKLARELGEDEEARWFRSQAQECRNGKNQLIYQH